MAEGTFGIPMREALPSNSQLPESLMLGDIERELKRISPHVMQTGEPQYIEGVYQLRGAGSDPPRSESADKHKPSSLWHFKVYPKFEFDEHGEGRIIGTTFEAYEFDGLDEGSAMRTYSLSTLEKVAREFQSRPRFSRFGSEMIPAARSKEQQDQEKGAASTLLDMPWRARVGFEREETMLTTENGASEVHYIESGAALMETFDVDGRQIGIDIFFPGDVVSSLNPSGGQTYAVKALRKTMVRTMPSKEFEDTVSSSLSFANAARLKNLEQLQRTRDLSVVCKSQWSEKKVASFIMWLRQYGGKQRADLSRDVEIVMPGAFENIASLISLSRPKISTALNTLQAKGIIDIRQSTRFGKKDSAYSVKILDEQALREVSGESLNFNE